MDVTPVDPRDTKWALLAASYRVYFWDESLSTLAEYEIRDADVPEVLSWADEEGRRSGRTYVVWLRTESASGPGLIRLAGWEQPSTEQPGEDTRPAYAVDRPLA